MVGWRAVARGPTRVCIQRRVRLVDVVPRAHLRPAQAVGRRKRAHRVHRLRAHGVAAVARMCLPCRVRLGEVMSRAHFGPAQTAGRSNWLGCQARVHHSVRLRFHSVRLASGRVDGEPAPPKGSSVNNGSGAAGRGLRTICGHDGEVVREIPASGHPSFSVRLDPIDRGPTPPEG